MREFTRRFDVFIFVFPGILEIKSVDVGVVAIRGLVSNHYLAIKKSGVLYGAVSCAFIAIQHRPANVSLFMFIETCLQRFKYN